MANFKVDENNNITRTSSGSKKGKATFSVSENGSIKRNKVEKKQSKGLFQSSKYFDDGYNFGDISKTFFWSGADLLQDVSRGFSRTIEGTVDTLGYLSADVLDVFGADDTADWLRDVSKYDVTGKLIKDSNYLEQRSVFGGLSDTVFEGVGNVGAMALTAGVTGGGVPSTVFSSFSSSYGNTMSEALRNGEDINTARKAAFINGTAEAISEQFFDALPGMKVEGWGSKVVGKIGSGVEKYFGTNTGKIAMKILNASGEGFEEIISNMLTSAGNDLMHMVDKNFTYGMEGQTGNILEDLKRAATSKESWSAFLSASLTSALTNGGNQFISNTQKNKLIKSYAQENNMTVSQVKQAFNQSVQQKTQSEMLKKPNMNLGQRVEFENQAKAQTMQELKRGTFVQPGTETQKYQYKETDNQKVNEMNKSLAEVGNNTQLNREAAATAERLIRDLGFEIEFTNNEKLQAENQNFKGKNINGFVKDGKMYLNIDSNELANFTIGHETKHFFEANQELNDALNQSLKEYAQEKGIWDKRLAEITDLYTDENGKLVGDPETELLADLTGEVFSNYEFVNNLSVKNPSLFEKVRDFFQKLYYKATGQREKLLIKNINDNLNRAYREYSKTQPKQEGTQYSLGTHYGDLGKARDTNFFAIDSSRRSTGHFGNGTYFVSQEESNRLNNDENFTRKARPKNEVEFDDYNLYKPKIESEGFRLHDGLKAVNYGDYDSIDFKMMKDDLIRNGISEEQINNAINKVEELRKELKDSDYRKQVEADSLSTSFMKELGFNGIDVRGLEGLDNTGYGSVIYDLDNKINKNAKYSLSVKEANTGVDNQGNEVKPGMQQYMANSKITDENGNIIKVYHTTGGENVPFAKAQFNVFNPVGTPGYRYGDQVVNFFTDSKDMSGSYVDQNYEMADTTKITSMNEAEGIVDYYNSSGMIDYSIQENDGKYELYDNEADEVLHTFDSQEDLFKNIKQTIVEYSQLDENVDTEGYQYEGYLNITNPYIIDAKGNQWNRIPIDNILELKQEFKEKWDTPENQLKELKGDTLKELNKDLTKLGYQLMNDKYGELGIFTKSGQLAADVINVNDVLQEIRVDLDNDLKTPLSTNDVVFSVLAENAMGTNYDGVIFKNVVDYGGANLEEQTPNNVYVSFKDNQFKASDNTSPTADADIRYSLSPKGEMVNNETGEKVELETSDVGNTGTLMAIHNLSEDKLNGVLDLGGFPVPSIAITSTDKTGQLRYGNITVLFDKNTINPQVKENEVYSSDIYSSRFPALENKINDNVINDLVKKSNYELSYQELKMLAEENKFNADRVPEDLMKVFFNDKGIEWNEQNRDYYENNDDGYNEYSKWVNDLSNQIIGEKRVVKPDVDYYTPSGNIRSIEQRTLPYTLENVVKIMTKKSTKGSEGNGWTGTGEIRGNLSPALNSIEEIKQNENKLITTEEMEQYKNKIEDDFSKITDKLGQYYKYKDTNSYYVLDTVADSINETAKAKKVNVETLKSKLADNFIEGVPDEVLNETIDFLNSLKNAPTEYFEAKPQRAVGLDEIQQVVIPSNSSQELRDRLQEMGIPFVEYNPEVEGDRQRVINQFDDLKFSLSQQGEVQSDKYKDLFPGMTRTTTRLSDLKRKEVELPTIEENALKTTENEQKQGEKPTRREVIDRNRKLAREQLGDITKIKDKKRGFLYQINTMKRNLRDIMSKEQAQKMYDTYFKNVTENNAKIENEINSYNERIQKYNLNDKESTYTQMVGELKYNPETTLTKEDVDNFYYKNANKIDQQKCEDAASEFRNIYDELIVKINDTLTDNGYKPIEYRKGYFPHFIEEKATSKLGKLAEKLGWKVQKGQLPTDIAGITDQFKPGKAWTSFSQQRTGDATDYNALKGLDNYLRGAMDIVYHTNDIQKLRALENEIRYQYSSKGIQEKIDNIYADDNLDMEEKNDAIANLTADMRGSGLGNFVTEIRNYTDNLANKKSFSDRSMEQAFGRDVYSIMNNINGRVSANMVGANISSAITNFIPITQAWGNISTKNLMKGMYESIKTSIKGDNFADKSTFLTNRTKQADRLYNTKLQKINKKLGIPFEAIDSFTANTIVRGKYYDNIAKGMSEQEAIQNADEFAKDVMAGRSKGDQPTMFNKKNPLVKLFTAFQLEVNNQYGYMFKDIPTNLADEAKDKLIGAFIKMFFGAWLYNEITEKFTGRRAAFDPIDMAISDVKTLTDENMDLGDKIQSIVKDTSQELPFVSGIMGGGRLPIQGAIPYSDPLSMITSTFEDIGKLDDPEKRKTAINNLKKEWSKPLYYVAMPFAGGQLKKTVEGLSMYDKDLPVAGSYTNSGKLRFEADTSTLGKIQSAVFGQYASKNAREYFEKGYTPLTEKQLNTALDANMSANEYREYNKGLKEQKSTEDKVDYIYDLPISNEQKNVLVNSALNRKDNIDLSDYGNYGSLEEFDYANKNPEKYLTITNITDYNTFQTYKNDLAEIKKEYNNTEDRKQAVFEYINSLPLSIEQKLMLQKMGAGYSIKQYRIRMHDYINSLDLTADEKQSIDDVLFK